MFIEITQDNEGGITIKYMISAKEIFIQLPFMNIVTYYIT
jgi:hypothetical protein